MPGMFNSKIFNPEVFEGYVGRVPNLKKTELLKSKALVNRNDLKGVLSAQTGGNYISTQMKGLISGSAPINYDGKTDITTNGTKTYMHSRIVYGRANGWVEDDFSFDITGGQDFLANVAEQIADYWNEIDQESLLAVLKGIFLMTGAKNLEFVNNHTVDVSNVVNVTDATQTGKIGVTTVNSAMQKALGDNKKKLSLIIMHSVVSTNLENLNLVTMLKYTDAQGLTKDLGMGTLHGRLVLVDDGMPVEEVAATYALTSDTELNVAKTYYTRSGSAGNYVYTVVASPVVGSIGTYYELTAEAYSKYTTYILGEGAIEYIDCGAKVPYEVERKAATNGGQDVLYSRQRKSYAPFGISYVNSSVMSPTNEDLATGANWALVNSQEDPKDYINHKAIPIARVISRG